MKATALAACLALNLSSCASARTTPHAAHAAAPSRPIVVGQPVHTPLPLLSVMHDFFGTQPFDDTEKLILELRIAAGGSGERASVFLALSEVYGQLGAISG